MSDNTLNEELVSAFLDSNQAFLERYLAKQSKGFSTKNNSVELDTPQTDTNIIDVTGKIAKRAREEARILSQTNLSLIDVAEDNSKRWQRLHDVSIGFMKCTDLEQFSCMLDEKLPEIFKLAGARLLMPEETAISNAEEAGFLVLPAQEILEISGAQSVYLGPPPKSGLALFSTPMASIAVISLPDEMAAPISDSVLLLAGRNKHSFVSNQADNILSNLSQVVGTCLQSIIMPRIEL
ncbi:MAG: DUF484 family protein [SAR116 cluster bacterium]|nr:MAG: DUF484 family protein [SAR116 cluster bacterium]|tara:strand:+ start:1727 stop:2437 length:711 start_codon:yes stop_codon:yes gene_type:complete